MQIHQIQPKTKRTKSRLVGRGGKRGKTSGRGHKGQHAHGGHGLRPQMRDIIKKLPKLRGHGVNRSKTVNGSRVKPAVVNLGIIGKAFKSGESVTPATLLEKKLISKVSNKFPVVKILATGDFDIKITITGCEASKAVISKVESKGGSVVSNAK